MAEQQRAYAELKRAAKDLASKAEAFGAAHGTEPEADQMGALCAGVAGLILDPGTWPVGLRPMATAVVAVVREVTDAAERARIACN